MQLTKRLSWQLVTLSTLLISCNEIQMPDIEVCQQLLDDSAYCQTTLSNSQREVSADEYYDGRLERFSISHEDFGKQKKFMLKACEILKDQCSMKDLKKTFERIETLKK